MPQFAQRVNHKRNLDPFGSLDQNDVPRVDQAARTGQQFGRGFHPIAALGARLRYEADPSVRDAILNRLTEIGTEAAARSAGRALAEALRANAARLKVASAGVEVADALAWLQRVPGEAFDLVFLDPPFDAGLWDLALVRLGPWLAPGAWIYVESPVKTSPSVPHGWRLHREGQTRDVRFALFQAGNGRGESSAATLAGDSTEQGETPE